jgi:hypothetical protein
MLDFTSFANISALLDVRKYPAIYNPEDIPLAIIDGIVFPVKSLVSEVEGNTAYVLGVNQEQFQKLCLLIQVRTLYFYEMRVFDLNPLLSQSGLVNLGIEWNTKLTDLSTIGRLTSLQTLLLMQTPKARDISAISKLTNLIALQIAGGLWSDNKVQSLNPISNLVNLAELRLMEVQVEKDGLRPLASCQSLKYVDFSNKYSTDDFAYLTAHLRNTKCARFAPWIRLRLTIDGKDIEITGKRKPHLNSRTDQKLIEKYSNEFLSLVRYYLSEKS